MMFSFLHIHVLLYIFYLFVCTFFLVNHLHVLQIINRLTKVFIMSGGENSVTTAERSRARASKVQGTSSLCVDNSARGRNPRFMGRSSTNNTPKRNEPSGDVSVKNGIDQYLWKKYEGDGVTLLPWQSMVSGFLAGFAGPLATGPFDVIKTRLMAQTRGVGDGEVKYRGLVHALSRIYAEEGLMALWKGLLPRLMRIPPGQAIMWAVADQVTGLYERRYLNNPAHAEL